MRKFWQRKPEYGSVWITPYLRVHYGHDSLTSEIKDTINRISKKLNFYTDRMVEYENQRNTFVIKGISYGRSTIQECDANWNIDQDILSVTASGCGFFKWSGSSKDFILAGTKFLESIGE